MLVAATDKSVQGSIISSVVPCINKRLETACEKITGKVPLIVGQYNKYRYDNLL